METLIPSPKLDFLPGPFILLLFVPAIPLLLFSIGARPPDTNHLPFFTSDLWHTTAMITVAGMVVLCVGVYPGAFQELGEWVVGGARDLGGGRNVPVGGRGVSGGLGRYAGIPPAGRPGARGMYRPGYPYPRPGNVKAPIITDTRRFASPASKHLTYLRESPLTPWYSPQIGNVFWALFFAIFLVAFSIVVGGRVIGDGYDAEVSGRGGRSSKPSSSSSSSSSSSREREAGSSKEGSWYQKEYAERKKEVSDPKKTEARWKKDRAEEAKNISKMDEKTRKEWQEKRDKEMQQLRGVLKQKNMPMIGLEEMAPTRRDRHGSGKTGVSGKEVKSEGGGEGKKKKGFWGSVQRGILGKQLYEHMQSQKTSPQSEGGVANKNGGSGNGGGNVVPVSAQMTKTTGLANSLLAQK